jgi:hypothetical protein
MYKIYRKPLHLAVGAREGWHKEQKETPPSCIMHEGGVLTEMEETNPLCLTFGVMEGVGGIDKPSILLLEQGMGAVVEGNPSSSCWSEEGGCCCRKQMRTLHLAFGVRDGGCDMACITDSLKEQEPVAVMWHPMASHLGQDGSPMEV